MVEAPVCKTGLSGFESRRYLQLLKVTSCSLAFTRCGSVWCGSPSTIPITFSN